MRPLIMDFVSDKKTHNIGNEYMFGRSILVAPVTKYGAKEWSVYLPFGSDWYNFWTNAYVKGGQTIVSESAVDKIPLYIKAGAILPFGPKVQYTTEKKWDNLEIRIYPGADGTFTLYEDEFDNYNYEKGKYTEIAFLWNDAEKKLTIADRKGSYSGMLQNRKFTIVLPSGLSKSVAYNGKKTEIKL